MAEYKETAKAIIKDAIKSAIFIDENALEPYMQDENISERERSVALYNNFREIGISLDIWKYDKEKYAQRREYIFKNRDLILLDWKLEGDGKGGEMALEILSDLVNNHKQIHFCVVYTAERPQDVIQDLLSYFSPVTAEESDRIKFDLAEYEEEINSVKNELAELSINRNDKDKQKELKNQIRHNHNAMVDAIHAYFMAEKPSVLIADALISTGVAFSDHVKSNILQNSPISVDAQSNTLYINNTFISVLNKRSVNPDILFATFGEVISNCKYGVMPLIGVEYQNIQRETGGVIDGALTQITQETLGYHKKIFSEDFETFLKTVLMEQDALHSRQKSMTITEAITQCDYNPNLNDEYVRLNVFFNSAILEGERKVSFGDVFKCDDDFYMCITALCDCARPFKREYQYYFAKGGSIGIQNALKIGDEGFVNFLSSEVSVMWNNKSEEGHLPTYIVPEIYLVPNNKISDGTLRVFKCVVREGVVVNEEKSFEYITTIKQNYAQRIANHAFSHPIRVGVDFVKYPKPDK